MSHYCMDALVAILEAIPTIPFSISAPCTPGTVPELTPLDSYSSLYIIWSMPDMSELTPNNFIETYEVQLTLQNPEMVKTMQVKNPGLELHELKLGEMVIVSVRAKCSCGNFGLQKTLCHPISKCDTNMMCGLCTKIIGQCVRCPEQTYDLNFAHPVIMLVQAHIRYGV